MARTAHIVRQTSESSIDLELNLDGTGKTNIETTVPFYNHMMTALGKHSLIDLNIVASGDTDIDAHHTVEDTAIVFGEALRQALGDKRGIRRRRLRPPILRVLGRTRRLPVRNDRRPLHRLACTPCDGIDRLPRADLPAHASHCRP